MSDRGCYQEIVTRSASQFDQLPPRHTQDQNQPLQNEKPQGRFSRMSRRDVLSRAALVTVLAVLGEIAALGFSSILNLGVTATAIALAGVVLSAMWPLARCAP